MLPKPYPEGLKPGDFIQPSNCFGDIFFEVVSCFGITQDVPHWMVTFITYDKYGKQPRTEWVTSATGVRQVIQAEMAVPTMIRQSLRFKAAFGQYDPIYGFAPAGTPLRLRDA